MTIPVIGSIWPGTAEMIYDHIGYARSIDPTLEAIDMPIMSNGGSAIDGLRGYAALKDSGLLIETKAPGGCDSAATLFFAAGSKRTSTKAGIFLCHNPYMCGGTINGVGTAEDHQATADELRMLEDRYAAVYAASSTMPAEHWKAVMAANVSITAEQAYEWGFVTHLSDTMPVEFDANASSFMASNNLERLTIMAEKNKSIVDALFSRVFGPKAEAVTETVADQAVAYNLATDQGELVIHTDGELMVGVEVTNPDGSPVQDATYTPANGGDRFRTEGGKIAEILKMEDDAAEDAALADAITAELEAVKASYEARIAAANAEAKAANARAEAAEAKVQAEAQKAESTAARLGRYFQQGVNAPQPPAMSDGANHNAQAQAAKTADQTTFGRYFQSVKK